MYEVYIHSHTLHRSFDLIFSATLDLLRRIYHMDLYRLPGVDLQELVPLNLEHVFGKCTSLIEWPVRLRELEAKLASTAHIMQQRWNPYVWFHENDCKLPLRFPVIHPRIKRSYYHHRKTMIPIVAITMTFWILSTWNDTWCCTL